MVIKAIPTALLRKNIPLTKGISLHQHLQGNLHRNGIEQNAEGIDQGFEFSINQPLADMFSKTRAKTQNRMLMADVKRKLSRI